MKKQLYVVPQMKMVCAGGAGSLCISVRVDGEDSGLVDTGEEGNGDDMAAKRISVWEE